MNLNTKEVEALMGYERKTLSGRPKQSAKQWIGAWTALTVLIGILGYIDYATGFEISFSVFYFIPIVFGAMRLGMSGGVSLSVISALTWGLADHYAGHLYSNQMVAVWNTLARLISFLTVAWMSAQITELLARERLVSQELRQALAELKLLEGLLPICGSCKKICDEQGNWNPIELYIQDRTSAKFTHGICPECRKKWLREAGLDDEPH